MGEVYKARDTSLDRTVAIKVLPDHIAQRIEKDTGAYASQRTTWKYDELLGGRFVVAERGAEALQEACTIHVISNWLALLDRKTAGKE